MKLSNLRPFVPSGDDFALAKRFFVDIGFVEQWGDEDLCELKMGDVTFLLQNFANSEMQRNYMVLVDVDDLDAFHVHSRRSLQVALSNKEAAAALGIQPGSFGRLCRLYDVATPIQRRRQKAQTRY